MIQITEYGDDAVALIEFLEALQDYLVAIDPLERLRRLPQYGPTYFPTLLQKISEKQGKIFIAKRGNIPVGMIAGIIEDTSEEEELEMIPTKCGVILELFVDEGYRGEKIGFSLMHAIEKYFQDEKCTLISIEVFVPNKIAHNFYQKLGYQDRNITVVKTLS